MKNFFLSLKTSVWTLLALVVLFFIGSYLMPVHPEVFSSMNDRILLKWVLTAASRHAGQTWWFFAAVAALVLLTINTLVCSIQAIKGKWSRSDFLLRVSPQVIHIGFLFILLAHLLGAGWGYKLAGQLPEGAYAPLPGGMGLHLTAVHAETDDRGFPLDWSADVSLYENKQIVKTGVLGPNRPLLYKGVGVYLKSLGYEQGPAAYILIARDPGAVWALAGGCLFILGSATLLALKWKQA